MAFHDVSGERNESALKGILGNVLFSGGNKNLKRLYKMALNDGGLGKKIFLNFEIIC